MFRLIPTDDHPNDSGEGALVTRRELERAISQAIVNDPNGDWHLLVIEADEQERDAPRLRLFLRGEEVASFPRAAVDNGGYNIYRASGWRWTRPESPRPGWRFAPRQA